MTPEEKAADACVALLEAAELTTVSNFVPFYKNDTAIGDEEDAESTLQKPCVVVDFIPSGEMFPQSGNIIGDLVLTIIANGADTTKAVYAAMKTEVQEAIYTDDLPARLTEEGTDFHCFGFAGEVRLNHRVDGKDFESQILIPLAVCGQTIAAS